MRWLFILLMSCMLGTASAATKSADQLYSEGIVLLERGDYDAAVMQLQAAQVMDPNNVLVQYQLGIAFYNIGYNQHNIDYLDYAQELWGNAASLLPEDNMLKTTLLDIANRAKINRDKISRFWLLEKHLAKTPRSLDEGIEYAQLLIEFDEIEQANAQYLELAKFFPNRSEPLNGQAELAIKQGRLGWAKSYFQRALLIDPNNMSAQKGLDELSSQLDLLSRFTYEELLKRSH